MKIISLILIIFAFNLSSARASELIGKISTNPKILIVNDSSNTDSEALSNSSSHASSSFGGTTTSTKETTISNDKKYDEAKEDDVLVLGITYFADHSLIRGRDKRIFLTKGNTKKHIKSLSELRKYSGQEIFDVTWEEWGQYVTRLYLDGELIREIGQAKIYHIENGLPAPVLNLAELANRFRGQEIFNINSGQMYL